MILKYHDLILYRISRAYETINEAKMLFDGGHLNGYVNRLYYACFYAVSALLLTKELSTGKHGYLKSLFHKEFIKPGIVPVKYGSQFDALFENRQKGDYEDLIRFKSADIAGWLEESREFIAFLEGMIKDLMEK